MDGINVKIGSRIRELRKQKRLTASELAERLDISTSAVCKYERGEQKFKLDFIKKLSNVFDVSTSYIMCMTDNPNIEKQVSTFMPNNDFYNSLPSTDKITFTDFVKSLPDFNEDELQAIIKLANGFLKGGKDGIQK